MKEPVIDLEFTLTGAVWTERIVDLPTPILRRIVAKDYIVKNPDQAVVGEAYARMLLRERGQ